MNMLNERGHFDHGREVILSPIKSVAASEQVKETARRRARAASLRSKNAERAKGK